MVIVVGRGHGKLSLILRLGCLTSQRAYIFGESMNPTIPPVR